MRVKAAHVRLCASRTVYVRVYPRETQEMVFDAHQRAFGFFGGVPTRGIYDNMKTAVDAVFVGKARAFNRRFLLMADHYMFDPVACTPASGWEKGQVENQVQFSRESFFKPRLRFASLEELNGWLEAECRRWASRHPHPEQGEITVAQALEAERAVLQRMLAPFDGFNEVEHAVSGTCLISFDRNRYSVMAKAAKRTVQVRALPTGSSCVAPARWSPSTSATSAATGRSMILGTTCRSWPASPAPCATAPRSRTGRCRRPWIC